LEFKYTKKELDNYLTWRTAGLAYKSSVWIIKAAEVFWKHTKGTIRKDSLDQLRAFLFKKYDDFYAQGKVLNFAKGFIKYQAKLTLDPRYLAFDMFLEKPKVLKVRKKMTARVVTKEDIEHVLAVIKVLSNECGSRKHQRAAIRPATVAAVCSPITFPFVKFFLFSVP